MKNQPTFADSEFTKSSTCQGIPSCVEVAVRPDVIGLRSTLDPKGTILVFTPDEWKEFVAGVKMGQFDPK